MLTPGGHQGGAQTKGGRCVALDVFGRVRSCHHQTDMDESEVSLFVIKTSSIILLVINIYCHFCFSVK